jgi:hypothetical protein
MSDGTKTLNVSVNSRFYGGTEMILHTDAIEVSALAAALVGLAFSVYATNGAYVLWRIVSADVDRAELKAIALRRLYLAASLCVKQLIISIAVTITLFLPYGETQSVVRNMTLLFISVLLLLRSLYEHWERPHASRRWSGIERRLVPREPHTTRMGNDDVS